MNVGPWLATLRGEGVRGLSLPLPRDLSCCEGGKKLTSTPSCSLERLWPSVAPGTGSTLGFFVAGLASYGTYILSPQFMKKHVFSLFQTIIKH